MRLLFSNEVIMASRFFQQFTLSLNHIPVFLEGSAAIGGSGATSALKGSGILSLTRVAAGTYKLVLEDDYNRFLGFKAIAEAPVTGLAITAGSFVSGTLYEIVTVGTTDYSAVGLDAGVTAAPGVAFVASGVGAGTGTVKALGASGVYAIELAGDPQLSVWTTAAGSGSIIYFLTLDASGSPVDPADGSKLYFQVWLRNSSVKGKGE